MSEPKYLSAPVGPGGTIGILGGGQLGRMLALAAARLGLKAHVFCRDRDAPAFQVCERHTVGAFDDAAALAAFAATCDAVTFEFENVPAGAVERIARLKPVNPGAKALRITQDRWEEKSFVQSLGLRTAAFQAVDSVRSARDAFAALGSSGVLKTRRLGYDGKGQAKVASADEAAAAIESFRFAPSILEAFVDFAFEASVVAARGRDGSFAAYDPPENLHEHHILRRSIVPGRLTLAQSDEAKAIARRIAEALDYVGVFAVELFVQDSGPLLVNEIAPRVHNSGHWTLEACAVSQFEQHIRAVAGWPLGDPSRHADAVMENILGEEAADWRAYAERPGALHLYGKAEIRAGRKMGHFTTLSPLTKPPVRP
ncbi:MAG TPA: 5-(carboxyamino)imidazole ribonucleotide synthase [Rhizomicrobium sp.]|nr:5-(carboxyamino)imidazole ribonucleotide synthase [Rhizomicrobium sp.]